MGRQKNTVIWAILAACTARAQAPLTFDVASIRPSTSDERPTFSIEPGGTVTVRNWALKPLIQNAYDTPGFFVFGAPNWTNFEKYDILAKANDSSSESAANPADFDRNRAYQLRMMARFQALLADRFQLKLHRETREMPGYALVVAKNGSKLHESDPAEPGLDTFKAPDGGKGQGVRSGPSTFRGGTKFTGQRASLTLLANAVTRGLGMPVVDRSGLKGEYDFVLEWAPDTPEAEGPTMFRAVEEQLGLHLESAKVPVEVLVIDRVEKPSEN
jgi:uncharacterized protein (TIGR03435 family)